MRSGVRLDRSYYAFSFSVYKNKNVTSRCFFVLATEVLFFFSYRQNIELISQNILPRVSFYEASCRLEIFMLQALCIKSHLPLARGTPLASARGPNLLPWTPDFSFCLADRVKAFFNRPPPEIFFPSLHPSHYFTTTKLSSQVKVILYLSTRSLIYVN
jgi:hypothetical protein